MCEITDKISQLENRVIELENRKSCLIPGAEHTIRYRMLKIHDYKKPESKDIVMEILVYALLHNRNSDIMTELDTIFQGLYGYDFYQFMETYSKSRC